MKSGIGLRNILDLGPGARLLGLRLWPSAPKPASGPSAKSLFQFQRGLSSNNSTAKDWAEFPDETLEL